MSKDIAPKAFPQSELDRFLYGTPAPTPPLAPLPVAPSAPK